MEEKIISTNTKYRYICKIFFLTVMIHLWFKSMLSHYRSHFSSLSKVWYRGHRISLSFVFFFLSFPSSITNQNSILSFESYVKHLLINDLLPND